MRFMELYQEEPGSSFTHDSIEYDLNKLLVLTDQSPVAYFLVSDLAWILAETDQSRIDSADLSAPILVTEWENKWVVIDGWHRLQKAVSKRVKVLPGKVVSAEQLRSVKKNIA